MVCFHYWIVWRLSFSIFFVQTMAHHIVRKILVSGFSLAFLLLAGCATPLPPPPPSHFELAQKAVLVKDYRVAGQEFEHFAKQELGKLRSGGDLKWIRNTALAYRDAANNYQLAGDTEAALRTLEMCISQMAVFADGELCETRGSALIKGSAVPSERISQFQRIASQALPLRENSRSAVQARIEARQRQALQAQKEWEAAAPEREWQEERSRIENALSVARASEQILTAVRKDASTSRMQRQLLETQLANHDLKRPTPTAVIPSAPATSGNVYASTGCKTTFAHLASRLPQYDIAELQAARTTILAEDLNQAFRRASSMGLSASSAAAQALQAADNADREAVKATACIRQFANDPSSVILALERGTFTFRGRQLSQLNINENCAAQYVLLKYTAIATREGAVQMACLAQAR